MNRNIIGSLAIVFAAFLWALEGIVLMPKLYSLDASFVVLMIHLIGFLILNLFLFKEYKYLIRFSGTDIFYLFLVSFFGGFLGTLAIVKALFLVNFNGLSIIVLLQKLQPVFAIILAILLLGEKPKRKFWLWALVAVLASYPLTFGFNLPDLTGDLFKASLWALLAAFSFGSATVFGKAISRGYDFHTVTFYRYGFTSIISFLYVMFFASFPSVSSSNWTYLIIIPLTTGIGGMFIYYYGLKKVPASVATICELFFPVSAVLLDWLINGKVLMPVQYIAAVIMTFAIYKISRLK